MIGKLKNNFSGKRGERVPADFLNTIANFFNEFAVIGGALQKRSDGKKTTILIPGDSDDPTRKFRASFVCVDALGTVATVAPGSFFMDGTCLAIGSFTGTISVDPLVGSVRAWLLHDTNTGTVVWATGTAFPAWSGTSHIYRLLEVYAVTASEDDRVEIGTIHHCHPADVYAGEVDLPTDTYTTIGFPGEHDGTRRTGTWSAGGTTGLKRYELDDWYFDHTAGTPKLMGVKRLETYSRSGKLLSVGGEEVHIEIDVPIDHGSL